MLLLPLLLLDLACCSCLCGATTPTRKKDDRLRSGRSSAELPVRLTVSDQQQIFVRKEENRQKENFY